MTKAFPYASLSRRASGIGGGQRTALASSQPVKKKPKDGYAEGEEDEESNLNATPEELAVAAAGLQFGQPTTAEAEHFGLTDAASLQAYLQARNAILVKWSADVSQALTLEACMSEGVAPDAKALTERAFKWLQLQGCINGGLVAAVGAPLEDLVRGAPPPPPPLLETLQYHLYQLLQTADMQVTTERQLRKQLEITLGQDLSNQRKDIRAFVERFLTGEAECPPQPSAPTADAAAPDTPAAAAAKKKIVVVGAGPAGLAAARHLTKLGCAVTVLEARARIGGRVHTDVDALSTPVDLGASIITGVAAKGRRMTAVGQGVPADPSAIVCQQLGLQLSALGSDLPLYDAVGGGLVAGEDDARVEALWNQLMDDARRPLDLSGGVDENGAPLPDSSLGSALEKALAAWEATEGNSDRITDKDRRLLHWHWANLEYGCAAPLSKVSLAHWNQDEIYGGFGGEHCMIQGGYSQVMAALAEGLDVQTGVEVTAIDYSGADGVTVMTREGATIVAAAVVITIPLGCLKAGACEFRPPLPEWKAAAVERLGFGNLNKIVLEFGEAFWDTSGSFFGAAGAASAAERGRGFMYWNLQGVTKKPMLIALLSGEAADSAEEVADADLVAEAVAALRTTHPEAAVPEPTNAVVTRWGKDEFSRGAYSYVAVGATGEDYDLLGREVGEGRVHFAGEHTVKEHPDTVGGAMLSGVRAATGVLRLLQGRPPAASAADAPPAQAEAPEEAAPEKAAPEEAAPEEAAPEAAAAEEGLPAKVEPAERSHKSKKKDRTSAVASSSDEDDDDDADVRELAKEQIRKRQEARAQISSLEAERSKGREEVKAVWRALTELTNKTTGRMAPEAMAGLLRDAGSDAVRTVLAQQLLKSTPNELLVLVEERELLRTVNAWICERHDGAGGISLLSALLRVLVRIPLTSFRHVRGAGLHDTLKHHCSNHDIQAIRSLAEQVAKTWTASTSKKPGPAPGAAKRKAALAVEGERAANQARAAGGARETTSQAAMTPEAAEGAVGAAADVEMAPLCTAEAAARSAAAAATRAAEAAAAAARTVADLPAVQMPSLMSFDRFIGGGKEKNVGKGKERASSKADALRRRSGGDHAKAAKDKSRESSGDQRRSESKKSAKVAGGDATRDTHALTKQVQAFVKHTLLDPLVQTKKLGKDDAKWVLTKASSKVLEARRDGSALAGDEPFLNKKRQAKIRDLVDRYVKQVLHQKKRKAAN